MSLDPDLRRLLTLPAICAPMFLVTGPALVREACKAGIIGGLPRPNARSMEEFEAWLKEIRHDLDIYAAEHPEARIGPIAVNLETQRPPDELRQNLDICARYGVELIISATGDPTALIEQVHDWGGTVFHDVISMRFAEKAIAAGADGLTAIGAGGGGHSGTVSHLALIPRLREIFDGTILLAGCVSNGATIRAAEILGADLAYLGTRFIATQESVASDQYKQFILDGSATDVEYTDKVSGVSANWLKESLRAGGLDPDNLPPSPGRRRYDHLPDGVRPWVNLWSAGQGVELIHDVPSVAQLVKRLRGEYVAACATPDMSASARWTETQA